MIVPTQLTDAIDNLRKVGDEKDIAVLDELIRLLKAIHLVTTIDPSGEIVMVSVQDSDHQIIEVLAQALTNNQKKEHRKKHQEIVDIIKQSL